MDIFVIVCAGIIAAILAALVAIFKKKVSEKYLSMHF
jgi:hypothetical protein